MSNIKRICFVLIILCLPLMGYVSGKFVEPVRAQDFTNDPLYIVLLGAQISKADRPVYIGFQHSDGGDNAEISGTIYEIKEDHVCLDRESTIICLRMSDVLYVSISKE